MFRSQVAAAKGLSNLTLSIRPGDAQPRCPLFFKHFSLPCSALFGETGKHSSVGSRGRLSPRMSCSQAGPPALSSVTISACLPQMRFDLISTESPSCYTGVGIKWSETLRGPMIPVCTAPAQCGLRTVYSSCTHMWCVPQVMLT